MPGRFFQPSIRLRLSGLSSGKLPRMPKRVGYLAAASSEILPEFGSQPGGCSRQALTPAASMSRMHSSAVYEFTWRCDGLPGGPADQMWTCASTISMAFLLIKPRHCEQIDEAIPIGSVSPEGDCFATLAMTSRVLALHPFG